MMKFRKKRDSPHTLPKKKKKVSSEYQGTLHNQLFGYKAKLIEGKYNIIIAGVLLFLSDVFPE